MKKPVRDHAHSFRWALRLIAALGLAICSAVGMAEYSVQTVNLPTTSAELPHTVTVALPDGYEDYPSRNYVTVYLLDAQDPTIFSFVKSAFENLNATGYIQPVILVGISTQARQFDFTPQAQTEKGKKDFRKSGGAEAYFRYIRDDVVATIESKFRCEPFRVCFGHSLGATFVTHTLLTHPGFFRAGIAISPNLVYDEAQLLRRVKEPQATKLFGNAFLYLANGKSDHLEEKFRPRTEEFAKYLSEHRPAGFRFIYKKLDNDYHGSTNLEGYPKGIVSLFENLTVPANDIDKYLKMPPDKMLSDLRSHYKQASDWSGLKLPMVWDLNNWAYNSFYSNKPKAALSLLETATKTFGMDINIFDSAADIAMQTGDLPLAKKYTEQGLQVIESQRGSLSAKTYEGFHKSFSDRLQEIQKKRGS